MGAVPQEYRTNPKPLARLVDQLDEFLIDRKARGLSPATVEWYSQKLTYLTVYLSRQDIDNLADLTPTLIRSFLLSFAETHNPGGTHGAFRAVRALCRWYSAEYDTPNACAKVQAPKVATEPLQPVSLADVLAMVNTCTGKSLIASRDRALLLFLLDSGCRRAEFLALDVSDLDMTTGAVAVRHGKGDKYRVAFIGSTTRKATRAYLKVRKQPDGDRPLWVTDEGGRLSGNGLQEILNRRARRAGVPAPSPHDFRRAFALNSLRAGVDLVSLQRLMGHSNLSVIQRYLRQTTEDLAEAHSKGSPVDRMLGQQGLAKKGR